jgi:hypothetical protein
VSENRNRPASDDAFLFIVNELERMSYISSGDAAAMREFIPPKPNGGGADGAKETN